MKVYELMEILSECNQEADVVISYPLDDGYEHTKPISDVAPYSENHRHKASEIELI